MIHRPSAKLSRAPLHYRIWFKHVFERTAREKLARVPFLSLVYGFAYPSQFDEQSFRVRKKQAEAYLQAREEFENECVSKIAETLGLYKSLAEAGMTRDKLDSLLELRKRTWRLGRFYNHRIPFGTSLSLDVWRDSIELGKDAKMLDFVAAAQHNLNSVKNFVANAEAFLQEREGEVKTVANEHVVDESILVEYPFFDQEAIEKLLGDVDKLRNLQDFFLLSRFTMKKGGHFLHLELAARDAWHKAVAERIRAFVNKSKKNKSLELTALQEAAAKLAEHPLFKKGMLPVVDQRHV